MKVIHILSHSPLESILGIKNPEIVHEAYDMEFIRLKEPPFWVSFFKGDFHVKMAENILKRTMEYQIECWRPYTGIKKPYSMEINGVLHRVFPSIRYRIPKLTSGEYSPTLIKALKQEIRHNRVLIHFHDGHTNMITSTIRSVNLDKVPVVYQQRGGWFAIFNRYKNPYTFYQFRRQLSTLRKIDYYFSSSIVEVDIMSSKWKIKKVAHFLDGIDYDKFIPADKHTSKKKLNIPEDKNVLLYIGRFYALKGVDVILKSYQILRKEYNLKLILVGGNKNDEFYDQLIKTDAMVIERIPEGKLMLYLRASDIYLMLPTVRVIKFGGLGEAPIEALACNVPVVSPNLIHFPGTPAEREGVGLIPKDKDDVVDCIRTILDNPQKFARCREISRKYFDINKTIDLILNKYKELFSKYYFF